MQGLKEPGLNAALGLPMLSHTDTMDRAKAAFLWILEDTAESTSRCMWGTSLSLFIHIYLHAKVIMNVRITKSFFKLGYPLFILYSFSRAENWHVRVDICSILSSTSGLALKLERMHLEKK